MVTEFIPPAALTQNAAAIILAGGKSRRMKTDKCWLCVDGRPLVAYVAEQLVPHFGQVLVSVRDVSRYTALRCVDVVADKVPDLGPVMGIISALEASRCDLNFIQACDIPKTDLALVQQMLRSASGHDVVMPRTAKGELEPLFAVYRKSALCALYKVLELERAQACQIKKHCGIRYVDLEGDYLFKNLNTIKDYRAFLQTL